MRAKRWVVMAVLGVVALIAPIGAASGEPDISTNAELTVSKVSPTVIAPSTTTNVVITGTGFTGETFSSNPPGVINTQNIDSDTQATLNVTTPATPTAVQILATGGGAPELAAVLLVRGPEGTFFGVTPTRISDTRTGIGGRSTPLGAGESYNVTVTGAGGVPATNVSGVVLNVTAVNTTGAPSWVTVYPTGGTLPPVSNLNFVAGQIVPNQVTVGVGTNGQVTVYNFQGSTDIIVDVVGYYVTAAASTLGSAYVPISPVRYDTRTSQMPVAAGGTLTLTFTGARTYSAVAINVTVDQPTTDGFLTTYPAGQQRPNASSLNFVAGQAVANLVTSGLGTGQGVTFYNGSSGTVHLIVDWIGGYTTDPDAFSFIFRPAPGGPFRLWDSRSMAPNRPLNAKETFTVPGGAIPVGTAGVVVNATVTQPTVGGWATVFAGGQTMPPSSTLNFASGETRANQTIPAPLTTVTRDILVYNDSGTAHYIIDVFGLLQLV